jgi:hypothetical protein
MLETNDYILSTPIVNIIDTSSWLVIILMPFIILIALIQTFLRFFWLQLDFSFDHYYINKKLNLLEEKTWYKRFKEMEETFYKTNRLIKIWKEIKDLTDEIKILKK